MAEEPAVDFGTFLRQAREKRGVSLQQVAATTKISARVLDALERNDPRKLPGGIFSRAFVRSYAREVGLDPESAVEQFVAAFPEQAATESAPTTVVHDDPENFESRRQAATTFLQLLGVSLLIVVIVVIYYSMRPSQPPPVRVVSEAAQEQQTPPPVPPEPGHAGPAGPAVTPAPPGPTPPAAVAGTATDAPLTIEIAASGACWLVLTVDGARVIARTLDPGEHVSYPVRTFVTVNAGNAGALSLTLNGKPAKPIGAAGQVVAITITPGTIHNFLQQP
jgi:cytoskeletal protein RodZ